MSQLFESGGQRQERQRNPLPRSPGFLTGASFAHQATFGNVWRYLGCSTGEVSSIYLASLVAQNPPAVQIFPGLGRSPGGGHGSPLQNSCLENPMDRGAWLATESDTTERLSTAQQLIHKVLSSFISSLLDFE